MPRLLLNRLSLTLALACLGTLAVGLLLELLGQGLLFENYLSTLSGWALIFALAHSFTRQSPPNAR